jgi:hypothetical protein
MPLIYHRPQDVRGMACKFALRYGQLDAMPEEVPIALYVHACT